MCRRLDFVAMQVTQMWQQVHTRMMRRKTRAVIRFPRLCSNHLNADKFWCPSCTTQAEVKYKGTDLRIQENEPKPGEFLRDEHKTLAVAIADNQMVA